MAPTKDRTSSDSMDVEKSHSWPQISTHPNLLTIHSNPTDVQKKILEKLPVVSPSKTTWKTNHIYWSPPKTGKTTALAITALLAALESHEESGIAAVIALNDNLAAGLMAQRIETMAANLESPVTVALMNDNLSQRVDMIKGAKIVIGTLGIIADQLLVRSCAEYWKDQLKVILVDDFDLTCIDDKKKRSLLQIMRVTTKSNTGREIGVHLFGTVLMLPQKYGGIHEQRAWDATPLVTNYPTLAQTVKEMSMGVLKATIESNTLRSLMTKFSATGQRCLIAVQGNDDVDRFEEIARKELRSTSIICLSNRLTNTLEKKLEAYSLYGNGGLATVLISTPHLIIGSGAQAETLVLYNIPGMSRRGRFIVDEVLVERLVGCVDKANGKIIVVTDDRQALRALEVTLCRKIAATTL